ncbi:hypothetical protein PUN28_008512 [Cardiocondyla obscurior]|uniref:Uncharacterized protein n=1 Tax=Cardiocondyla obscurior TaxID=286306 RepID=A0AAW2G437_9HYME
MRESACRVPRRPRVLCVYFYTDGKMCAEHARSRTQGPRRGTSYATYGSARTYVHIDGQAQLIWLPQGSPSWPFTYLCYDSASFDLIDGIAINLRISRGATTERDIRAHM